MRQRDALASHHSVHLKPAAKLKGRTPRICPWSYWKAKPCVNLPHLNLYILWFLPSFLPFLPFDESSSAGRRSDIAFVAERCRSKGANTGKLILFLDAVDGNSICLPRITVRGVTGRKSSRCFLAFRPSLFFVFRLAGLLLRQFFRSRFHRFSAPRPTPPPTFYLLLTVFKDGKEAARSWGRLGGIHCARGGYWMPLWVWKVCFLIWNECGLGFYRNELGEISFFKFYTCPRFWVIIRFDRWDVSFWRWTSSKCFSMSKICFSCIWDQFY